MDIVGARRGADVIVNRPSRILYDPKNPDIFWESGIYNSSGIYHTSSAGQTFQHLGSASITITSAWTFLIRSAEC